jgi:small subunit ribosomal protein S16
MVRIRLRRIGTKARPFYRIVVAKSQAGRNGAFVETIGTYDPTRAVKLIEVNEERAIHWLLAGAQPSETTAYILNKSGVLPKFFEQRPKQKKNYKFLDKRTAATSVASSVDVPHVETPEPETPAVEAHTAEPEAATAE